MSHRLVPQRAFAARVLSSALVCGALAFAAPLAQASIVSSPASIVDHGSYITDLVAGRDWYKFSNAASTIGLSFEQALVQFAPFGWSGASLDDVQSLQSRFGWTADTPSTGLTPNDGLTDAMAAFLGYTGTYFFDGRVTIEGTQVIEGVTKQAVYLGPLLYHLVTASQTFSSDFGNGSVFYTGDYVDGEFDVLQSGASDMTYGVWLTRLTGSITNPAGPGPNGVPEPGTAALLLVGFAAWSRRRAFGAPRLASA